MSDTTLKYCYMCKNETDCIQNEDGKWLCEDCSSKIPIMVHNFKKRKIKTFDFDEFMGKITFIMLAFITGAYIAFMFLEYIWEPMHA